MRKKYYVYTVEHRLYSVRAKSPEQAREIVIGANLKPKDSRVKLVDFGDFEIESVQI